MKTLIKNEKKKKLLFLSRNLPPLVGGMERLLWQTLAVLQDDYEITAIGPRGSAKEAPSEIIMNEIKESPLYLFLWQLFWQAMKKAHESRPAIIFAGNGLVAPITWLSAQLFRAKSVVYLHGLDIESKNFFYRLFFLPFVRRCSLVIVNSQFTYSLARQAGVPKTKIALLPPGTDLPSIKDYAAQRSLFRENYGLGDAFILLYIGRITQRKGLLPFIRDVFPEVLANLSNARLLVIGEAPKQALVKTGEILTEIQQVIKEKHLENKIIFLGKRAHDDPEITQAYFAADVHIFPIQARPGDNEGFGMVAIEAAAHGLPTVAYRAGGVSDAVADGISGYLIEPQNNQAFAKAVLQLAENSLDKKKMRDFAANFAWPVFSEKLKVLLENVTTKLS